MDQLKAYQDNFESGRRPRKTARIDEEGQQPGHYDSSQAALHIGAEHLETQLSWHGVLAAIAEPDWA